MKNQKKIFTKKNVGEFFKESILYLFMFPAIIGTIFITLQQISYTPVTDWLLSLNFLPEASAAMKVLALSFITGAGASPLFVGVKKSIKRAFSKSSWTEIDSSELPANLSSNSTKDILKGISLGVANGYAWAQFTNLIVTVLLIKMLVESKENPSLEELEQAEKTINIVADTLMTVFAASGYSYGYNVGGPDKSTIAERVKAPVKDPISLLLSVCRHRRGYQTINDDLPQKDNIASITNS